HQGATRAQSKSESLNCLSAGSVSLTFEAALQLRIIRGGLNCLSAGSVSLTAAKLGFSPRRERKSQLPFGWVCFSNRDFAAAAHALARRSQLPFGWVCFSNASRRVSTFPDRETVSIAFRLGLFL